MSRAVRSSAARTERRGQDHAVARPLDARAADLGPGQRPRPQRRRRAARRPPAHLGRDSGDRRRVVSVGARQPRHLRAVPRLARRRDPNARRPGAGGLWPGPRSASQGPGLERRFPPPRPGREDFHGRHAEGLDEFSTGMDPILKRHGEAAPRGGRRADDRADDADPTPVLGPDQPLPPSTALVGVDAVFLLGTGIRGQAEGEIRVVNAAKAACEAAGFSRAAAARGRSSRLEHGVTLTSPGHRGIR